MQNKIIPQVVLRGDICRNLMLKGNCEKEECKYIHDSSICYFHWKFEKCIKDSGAILITVELTLRDRHFEVTNHNNPNHIQLKSDSTLWSKENLINIGIRYLPQSWEYAGYIDADFHMTRSDWVQETLHQLQHYSFIQLFSSYADLAQDYTIHRQMPSFMFVHKNPKQAKKLFNILGQNQFIDDYSISSKLKHDKSPILVGASGGAWAWRREAFDDIGGIIDFCILGSGDWHFAFGLTNKVSWAAEGKRCTNAYIEALKRWCNRAKKYEFKCGYIENHAIHSFHGSKINRTYGTRWEILQKHQYDPLVDVKYDSNGILSFTGNKPALEEDVRNYFRTRKEDS